MSTLFANEPLSGIQATMGYMAFEEYFHMCIFDAENQKNSSSGFILETLFDKISRI